ncbi:MAG: undecaprenyl-phosphate glucose phosphotransferase [Hydrogenophilales bacterium 28-61-23]|nr:MAG: undecaprenyl-phosphate glucose phosphotransferase [Hydrogenophilales bacterium 28-61-23]
MPPSHSTPLNLLNNSTSLASFLKAIWDPAVAVAAVLVSTFLYGEKIDGPEILLVVVLFSMLYPGNIPLYRSWLGAVREVVTQWLPALAVLFLLGFSTHSLEVFPVELLIFWAVAVPLLWLVSHLFLPTLAPGLFAMEGIRSAVIIGANDIGRRLAGQFANKKHLAVEFMGFFDDRSQERIGELPHGRMLGRFDQVASYIRQTHTDAIFIALPMASQPRILKLLDDLKDSTLSIYFVPDIFITDLIQARVDEIGDMPVVAVRDTPFKGLSAVAKRLSDIVIASLILVLIAPIMLMVAIAVWRSSPGPILFKQRRYGLDGKDIVVYKFRSMTVCEDGAQVVQATKNDQRITRVGAFIRRTSLDELPQFINVLQGRMSVVGPRPHAVAHNELYRKVIKGYMVRHKVKPGITGLAQVNGYRGETDTVEKMQKRIEYDLEYLRKWSLHLDLEIILRTVGLVFRDKKAY